MQYVHFLLYCKFISFHFIPFHVMSFIHVRIDWKQHHECPPFMIALNANMYLGCCDVNEYYSSVLQLYFVDLVWFSCLFYMCCCCVVPLFSLIFLYIYFDYFWVFFLQPYTWCLLGFFSLFCTNQEYTEMNTQYSGKLIWMRFDDLMMWRLGVDCIFIYIFIYYLILYIHWMNKMRQTKLFEISSSDFSPYFFDAFWLHLSFFLVCLFNLKFSALLGIPFCFETPIHCLQFHRKIVCWFEMQITDKMSAIVVHIVS